MAGNEKKADISMTGNKSGKPSIDGKTLKRLMSYIVCRHKLTFFMVVVCILISSCTVVVSSLFLQILIDNYITPMLSEVNPSFAPLLKTIIMLGCLYLVGVLSTFAYNKMMIKISQGTLKAIRDDMFTHMQTLPIRYFDTHTHGDVMSHYTNDTDTLRQFISQALPQFISAVVTIVVVIVSMIVNSIPLTILVLAVTCIMQIVSKKIGGASARYFIRQQITIGKVTGFIEEMINGQKVIKVFCHEDEAKYDFDKNNEMLCSDATNANKYGNILMPAISQLGNLQYVLIALIGGFLALRGIGGITVGMIVAFLNLSKTFCMPVSQIAQQISMIAMALAGAERIFGLIDEKPEEDEGDVTLVRVKCDDKELNNKEADNKDARMVFIAGEVTETTDKDGRWAWKCRKADNTTGYILLRGKVVFDDVIFGYNENKIILNNINLWAKSGQKIAFVGATGAGKTTITNLINRFYDINSGNIFYDGISIDRIKKDDLRHSLGIVLQDVNLFTGTIMDNIRYGNLLATDEECIKAAKLANADDFITRLPDGYQTVLTQNGASLSQGQRQLISIARAAVANPPVMILDEATSSIDTRTEALVQRGMDNLMKGRTVFVIAHRLSTVRNSDAIMVLDHGNIIERGSHDELIASKGTYYSLYTGAFELS